MKKPDEYEILERAHQAAGAHMMQKSPRADELIACLEGEIAKRDEELASCRVSAENCELFRARIAELEQDLAYFPSTVRSLAETVTEREAEINQLRAELSAIKAQGVVMPEPMKRGDEGGSGEYGAAIIRGYNACLREVARLNADPAAPAADAGMVAVEWAKDAEEWGPALNEAGWLFLSELNEDPKKSALIFNNCKGPLRAAIMKYAEIVAALAAHRADGVV